MVRPLKSLYPTLDLQNCLSFRPHETVSTSACVILGEDTFASSAGCGFFPITPLLVAHLKFNPPSTPQLYCLVPHPLSTAPRDSSDLQGDLWVHVRNNNSGLLGGSGG